MDHLSAALEGVILLRDNIYSHMDDAGNIIDNDLDIQIFQKADKVVIQLWSNTV